MAHRSHPFAVRRHRRPSHALRISTGLLCAALVATAAAGIAHYRSGAAPDAAAPAAIDERAERASRSGVRATVTPSTPPSPIPAASTPVSRVTPRATTAAPATTAPASTRPRATTANPLPPVPADCTVYTGNRRIGCSLLPTFGFALSEMPALDKLWTRESNWNHLARNPSSGAYGIPQALPGSKMATAGADWETNPATQIKWGLGYIKGRYGTPTKAWAFFQANNWY